MSVKKLLKMEAWKFGRLELECREGISCFDGGVLKSREYIFQHT